MHGKTFWQKLLGWIEHFERSSLESREKVKEDSYQTKLVLLSLRIDHLEGRKQAR